MRKLKGETVMNHKHEWVVYSTAMKECWLMLQCVECGAMATVDDPTKEEWGQAFHAPSRPYRWTEEGRVYVQHEPPCPLHVVRTVKGATTCSCPPKAPGNEEREYECFPAEIVKAGEPLTEEDVAELEELAELVRKSDVCSRVFPLFIRSYQDHTGHEPTGAVKRIAASIEKIDQMACTVRPRSWRGRCGSTSRHRGGNEPGVRKRIRKRIALLYNRCFAG